MNLKKEILHLVNELGEDFNNPVSSILMHIDRAQHFYKQADSLKEEQYYTDVIYRTNQAYEGILKFAYLVFTGGHEDRNCNLRTYEIENYFEEQQVFNSRVKESFILYRRLWRNLSTHDHELFFERDEAFLAITHVMSFAYILLYHCAEFISYRKAKFLEAIYETEEIYNISTYEDMSDVVVKKLKVFHESFQKDIKTSTSMPHIIGAIKGYLERNILGLEAIAHYKGNNVIGFQPDIIISIKGKIILFIEVKIGYSEKKLELGRKQLKEYFQQPDVEKGVLYFYTDKAEAQYEVNEEIIHDKYITILKPSIKKE